MIHRGASAALCLALVGHSAIGAAEPKLRGNYPDQRSLSLAGDRVDGDCATTFPHDFDSHLTTAMSTFVDQKGALSIQLDLRGTILGGDAKLVITSADDLQTLDAAALLVNHHHSAIFLGDRVDLDLVPSSDGEPSRIVVPAYTAHGLCGNDDDARPMAAEQDDDEELPGICGVTDSRVLSSDVRVARFFTGIKSKTAWLISEDVFVTCGHRPFPEESTRVSFGERLGGQVEDQYPVDLVHYYYENDGWGADWAVGRLLPNTETGLTAGQAQGAKCGGTACAWFAIGTVPETPGDTRVRLTGHGITNGAYNGWQKTNVGDLFRVEDVALAYWADATGSDSGGVLTDEETGLAIGIHTHGSCPEGANKGQRIDTPALADKIEAMLATHAWTACGRRGRCDTFKEIASVEEEHPVRCCADSNIGTGWVQHGGCSVWGESEIDGECEVGTYLAAMDHCESVGARLCTLDEMYDQCARLSGCGYDYAMVWTATTTDPPTSSPTNVPTKKPTIKPTNSPTNKPSDWCTTKPTNSPANQPTHEDGYSMLVCGRRGRCTPSEEVANMEEEHSVRCCSDSSIGPGWKKNNQCFRSVWGESEVGGQCSVLTYHKAKDLCSSHGARLCTYDEMDSDCTRGTGCGYDNHLVWTATKIHSAWTGCGKGETGCSASSYIHALEEEHPVRCCSDSNIGTGWVQNSGCSVWAESEVCGQCSTLTWEAAKDLCSSAGARLCTLEEMMNGCTQGTGCGFDSKQVWTALPFFHQIFL